MRTLGDRSYRSPDGPFVFDNTSWTSFADLQSRSPYEAHGRILSTPIFQTPLSFPADYTTFWSPRDVALHASSNAIDAGLVIQHHGRIRRERAGSGGVGAGGADSDLRRQGRRDRADGADERHAAVSV